MLTNDVYARVGSSRIIVAVAEGKGSGVLVGKLSLGADTSETPRGVGPMEQWE